MKMLEDCYPDDVTVIKRDTYLPSTSGHRVQKLSFFI